MVISTEKIKLKFFENLEDTKKIRNCLATGTSLEKFDADLKHPSRLPNIVTFDLNNLSSILESKMT